MDEQKLKNIINPYSNYTYLKGSDFDSNNEFIAFPCFIDSEVKKGYYCFSANREKYIVKPNLFFHNEQLRINNCFSQCLCVASDYIEDPIYPFISNKETQVDGGVVYGNPKVLYLKDLFDENTIDSLRMKGGFIYDAMMTPTYNIGFLKDPDYQVYPIICKDLLNDFQVCDSQLEKILNNEESEFKLFSKLEGGFGLNSNFEIVYKEKESPLWIFRFIYVIKTETVKRNILCGN